MPKCMKPPAGWECARKDPNHSGPCAAIKVGTEQEHIDAAYHAWAALKRMGWVEPQYGPKDGSLLDIIEPGSTGIHTGHYEGQWPSGHWWIHDAGDLWPSRPLLVRPAKITDKP